MRATSAKNGRRFGMLDGMILIAASAVVLGVFRMDGFGASMLENVRSNLARPWWWPFLRRLMWTILPIMTLPLVVATLAVLLLRLRQPRPRWRRLIRQPGFVAGLAMVPAWVVVGCDTVARVNLVAGMSPGGTDRASGFSVYPCLPGRSLASRSPSRGRPWRWSVAGGPKRAGLTDPGGALGAGWIVMAALWVFSEMGIL